LVKRDISASMRIFLLRGIRLLRADSRNAAIQCSDGRISHDFRMQRHKGSIWSLGTGSSELSPERLSKTAG